MQVVFYDIGDTVGQVVIFFFLFKENEDVVEAALRRNCDRFTLEHCLPSWIHRGLPVFPGGRHITSLFLPLVSTIVTLTVSPNSQPDIILG